MSIQGRASEAVVLPFTTMQQTYNLGSRIDVLCFTVKRVKVSDVQPGMEQIIKKRITRLTLTSRCSGI